MSLRMNQPPQFNDPGIMVPRGAPNPGTQTVNAAWQQLQQFYSWELFYAGLDLGDIGNLGMGLR